MRFKPENRLNEIQIGIVDISNNRVLSAQEVLRQIGVNTIENTAIEIIQLNTNSQGELSDKLKDLNSVEAANWNLDDIVYLPPVEATSLRDFIAFEEHIKTVRGNRGAEVPDAWYEMPVYYKGNHKSLLGHQEPIIWPDYSEVVDYELELGAFICKEGTNISETEANSFIGGYTIMNDWSARDIQFREQSVGLGPSKGKDFGTSLGPWLVTPDEFDVLNSRMIARVNSEIWSDNNIGNIYWSINQMIEHASKAEILYPGDVFGSGTVGGGCGAEHGNWLQNDDVIELEVEGIGKLRSKVSKLH